MTLVPIASPQESVSVFDNERSEIKTVRQFVTFTHSFLLTRIFTAICNSLDSIHWRPFELVPGERPHLDEFGLSLAILFAMVQFYVSTFQIHLVARYGAWHFILDLASCFAIFGAAETLVNLKGVPHANLAPVWLWVAFLYTVMAFRIAVAIPASAPSNTELETRTIPRTRMDALRALRQVGLAAYVGAIFLSLAGAFFTYPKFAALTTMTGALALSWALAMVGMLLYVTGRERAGSWRVLVLGATVGVNLILVFVRLAFPVAASEWIVGWRYRFPVSLLLIVWCLVYLIVLLNLAFRDRFGPPAKRQIAPPPV